MSIRPVSRLRSLAVNAAIVAGSLLAVVLLLEAALRLVPSLLPPGSYGPGGRFDPDLAMNVHGGPVVYNKVRTQRRVPNADGFMDVEHRRGDPESVIRVGYFGDSYVEAVQLPLEASFFRQMPVEIAGRRLEHLGFGISGWGTIHSRLNAQVQAARYGLDVLVYVFAENDLGNNALRLQPRGGAGSYKPYADLDDDPPGYRVEWLVEPQERRWWVRAARAVRGRSLLAQIALARWRLLRLHGVAMHADEDAMTMNEPAGPIPHPSSVPGTWPGDASAHARELGRRILADWAAEARAAGRILAVLYVPRNELMLRGERPLAETWRPWLEETCRDIGLPLLDPTEAMRARLILGEKMYDDHWTAAGHRVVAEVLTGWLASTLGEDAPGPMGAPGGFD